MKGVFISSLLLLHFYLDAVPEKSRSVVKKQKRSSFPLQLTEATYKKIFNTPLAIVMVSADWCQYCKSAKPLFLENCSELYEQALFALIDLGENFLEKSAVLKHQISQKI